MSTKARDEQHTEATFVFKGTVQQVKGCTVKNIVPTDQTLVVTVDQIITAPRLLAKWGGRRITVQLSGRQTAQPGQALIFHTYGWVFGDGLAVQSVRQEAVKRSHITLLSAGGDPVEHRRSQSVQKRFTESEVVISGQVATVRLPAESRPRSGRRRAAATATSTAGPVSEHTPHWREAVIHVDDVHKGTHDQKEIVIRFPASTDVRWYRAPKFQPGQQGHFMLHKTKVKNKSAKKGTRAAARGVTRVGGAAAAADDSAEGEEVYTALHPMDYQPYGESGGIGSLLESSTDEQEG
jgi:hypothetical protein